LIHFEGEAAILVVITNITERKRAEEQIQALSRMPDESPNPILRVTADSVLLYANRTSQPLLDMWQTKIGQALPDVWRREIAAVFQSDTYKEVEVPCGEKVFSLILTPIVSAGYVNLYGRDVTIRKQAQAELARQSEELARLYRASGALHAIAPFDLPTLSQTIVEVVLEEFGQANCSVFLIQSGSDELKRMAVAGPYAGEVRKTILALDGPGQVSQAIRSGQVINTPDVRTASAYLPSWEAARSELTLPLKVGEKIIGAIDVQSATPDAFQADDERLMSIFAERATLILEHARLYAQTEQRLQNLMSLRAVDMAIAGSFDLKLTLGILLDQVLRQLGIHAADVLIFNPVSQSFHYSAGQGFFTQALQHTDLHMGDGYAGQAARERRVVTIRDLRKNTGSLVRSADFSREGFQTYVGVPLLAKGQIKGVLELFQRGGLSLDEEQQAFLDMLAGQAAIAIESAQLFENLQGSNAELMMAYDETIEGWSHAMDLRDEETEGHSERVTGLTLQLASSLGFKAEDLVHLRRGALLHDIGKIGVPDEILRKPGSLSEDEWVIMRKHPQFAYDMLAPIAYLHKAIEIPFCHHEKWDGAGYPRGLKGEDIPFAARIFAVVDVWDALRSDRPYRKAWSREKALEYIREQSGKHFDPRVVDVFLRQIQTESLP
jgi:HD-GYP domain-containing protein (c-di-GMP phosphodiesterase class II)